MVSYLWQLVVPVPLDPHLRLSSSLPSSFPSYSSSLVVADHAPWPPVVPRQLPPHHHTKWKRLMEVFYCETLCLLRSIVTIVPFHHTCRLVLWQQRIWWQRIWRLLNKWKFICTVMELKEKDIETMPGQEPVTITWLISPPLGYEVRHKKSNLGAGQGESSLVVLLWHTEADLVSKRHSTG